MDERNNIEDKNLIERYNQEMIDYVEYITWESDIKPNLIKCIKNEISQKTKWKVHVLGSFEQNLSTMFSDIDFTIETGTGRGRGNENQTFNDLDKIREILQKFILKNQIIKSKNFPIINAKISNIMVDISVNQTAIKQQK